MKFNAKIDIFVSGDHTEINVYDDDASRQILKLRLTPKQFCQAVGRLAHVPIESAEAWNLDLIGKQHECKEYRFPIPADVGVGRVVLFLNWVQQRHWLKLRGTIGALRLLRTPPIMLRACTDPHVAMKEENLWKRNSRAITLVRVEEEGIPIKCKHRVC